MKKLKKICIALIACMLIGILSLFGIDLYVRLCNDRNLLTVEEVKALDEDFDCIVVLGAGLNNDGTPSPMLKERLDKGIELYNEGVTQKIIMSGDHASSEHDEVNAMKTYAVEKGIPPEDIFMDHAGISTYDSMYRAKNIFKASKVLVVTQKYHLYRAMYIGNSLGIETIGVDAEKTKYAGTAYRETREVLARIKDFFKCFAKPQSFYVGESIPVFGDGNITNDRDYIIIESYSKNEKKIYISKKDEVNKIKSIIEAGEFKKETCDCIPDYTIDVNGEEEYYLIVSEKKIIIRFNKKELTLGESDSEFMKMILES